MIELYYLALILLVGLICGKLTNIVKLPNVTGYLIGGLILGPSILNIVPAEAVTSLSFLSNVALAFIALAIGFEFKISYFKTVGAKPFIIATSQAVIAVLIVIGALILCGFDVALSVVLGSIAAATAPAITIMIVKQYKSEGPTTQTLLNVVGIGDAVALICFNVAITIAQILINPSNTDIAAQLLHPLIEIGSSIAVGALLGLGLVYLLKIFKDFGSRESIIYVLAFFALYFAKSLNLSDLLTCMVIGAVFTNMSDEVEEVEHVFDVLTPPLYLAFFAISGADLNIAILPSIGLIGVVYIVVRIFGKVFGAWLGAKLCGASKEIQNYLGFALIPQTGMAIGLSAVAQQVLPEYATTIKAVVLCAILVYQFIGPSLTKWALVKSGDIVEIH